MTCPDCDGQGCTTCGGVGTVPDWLADPNITGESAKDWAKNKQK
ncbi:hypothetical protein [Amycolatopsis pithecellobii]|nr:hypothetical protein [Amycolatopsis pithecellobii]